jgi:hypothetical protein
LIEPLRKLVARVKGHYLQAYAVDVDFGERLVEVKGREKDDEPFYVRKFFPWERALLRSLELPSSSSFYWRHIHNSVVVFMYSL